MSRARRVRQYLSRLLVSAVSSILVVALVGLGGVARPSMATAQQLTLTWVDNSGGLAGFIIQRATDPGGTFTPIAQQPPGITSYVDTTVAFGTSYCYEVAASDSAGTSAFSNVACGSPAGAAPSAFTVAVSDMGSGVGTVASSPAGITCGTACSATYPGGTMVTLVATPAPQSTFSGWSGGGCSGTGSCTLVGDAPVAVTATFTAVAPPPAPSAPPATYKLRVSKSGRGSVTSSPQGIKCGWTCSANYTGGTLITLTATPRFGYVFSGWSGGGCTGTSTCTVTLDASTVVTASFQTSF